MDVNFTRVKQDEIFPFIQNLSSHYFYILYVGHFIKHSNNIIFNRQARLSRRQLPRITQDGLVEYSLQIPASAIRQYGTSSRGNSEKTRSSGGGTSSDHSPRQPIRKYGADIDWILSGRKKE